ncbi:hypothetical protein SS50377_25170 [Spironucleus salmonicida]|nr:hypothetical protein SS50377_25170 [Spironucleus salmonicida]
MSFWWMECALQRGRQGKWGGRFQPNRVLPVGIVGETLRQGRLGCSVGAYLCSMAYWAYGVAAAMNFLDIKMTNKLRDRKKLMRTTSSDEISLVHSR